MTKILNIQPQELFNTYQKLCQELNIEAEFALCDIAEPGECPVDEVLGYYVGILFDLVSENPDDWENEILANSVVVENTETWKAFTAKYSDYS